MTTFMLTDYFKLVKKDNDVSIIYYLDDNAKWRKLFRTDKITNIPLVNDNMVKILINIRKIIEQLKDTILYETEDNSIANKTTYLFLESRIEEHIYDFIALCNVKSLTEEDFDYGSYQECGF